MVAADAFPDAGLGHLSRSSAVAVALRARGVAVDALALGAPGPVERDGVAWTPIDGVEVIECSTVLVDSYRTPREAIEQLAARTAVAVMHDGGEPPAGTTLVVDAAADPSLACLRPAFWGLPAREVRDAVQRVLVTTGGGDPGGRGAELATAARDALPDATVALVRGPQAAAAAPAGVELVRAPPLLLGELLRADLVVSAGGQTMLEAAACGTPCVAVAMAPNQERQVAALAGAGAVATELGAIGPLAEDRAARATLAAAARRAVDGYGALRVAYALERLSAAARRSG